jgi:hypothetical protein
MATKPLGSYWLVETGMRDPRDKTKIGWRDFGAYPIEAEAEAKREFRRLGPISRFSRVDILLVNEG